MKALNIVSKWAGWGPQMQSVLRIVAALLFILPGTMKLFAFPAGHPPGGRHRPVPLRRSGSAAFSRSSAAPCSSWASSPAPSRSSCPARWRWRTSSSTPRSGFWPVLNGGVAAALYCFVWLYFSAAGAGPWSLDARRGKR